MQGFITGKHLILNGSDIIRGFGFRCWLRCLAALLADRPTTFLAVACAVSSRQRR
jgi:hypothetical protein